MILSKMTKKGDGEMNKINIFSLFEKLIDQDIPYRSESLSKKHGLAEQEKLDYLLQKIREDHTQVTVKELKELIDYIQSKYHQDLIIRSLSKEELIRNMDFFLRALSELIRNKRKWGQESKHYVLSNIYKASLGLKIQERKDLFFRNNLYLNGQVDFRRGKGSALFKFFFEKENPYLFIVHEYGYCGITNSIEEIVSCIESTYLRDIGYNIIDDGILIFYKEADGSYTQVTFEKNLTDPKWRDITIHEEILWCESLWNYIGNENSNIRLDEAFSKHAGNSFIYEQIKKCDNKLQGGDYEGAITNARTLLEILLLWIENKYSEEKNEYDGDLVKLYRRVQKLLNLDPSRKDISESTRQVMSSLNGIVSGISALRNKMSDSHASSFRPDEKFARLAVNSSKTLCNFLIDFIT